MLHTDIEKKNSQWRRSKRTEERLALTVRLVVKMYITNNLSTWSPKQTEHTPEGSNRVKNMEDVNVICWIWLCWF
jgi:hypothetical protein